jgi:hypothetical protein
MPATASVAMSIRRKGVRRHAAAEPDAERAQLTPAEVSAAGQAAGVGAISIKLPPGPTAGRQRSPQCF